MSPAGPQPLLRSRLPGDVVLDGELVIWDAAAGRLDFAALSRRIVAGRRIATVAAAHPARRGRLERLVRTGKIGCGGCLSRADKARHRDVLRVRQQLALAAAFG